MSTFSPRLSVLTSLYKSEDYLPDFLKQIQAQSLFPNMELVLVLNAPNLTEKELVQSHAQRFPERTRLLEVNKVETLGASWNRAWRAARAPQLAIWNVDDRREADSLERQLSALHSNPDWVLCFGDYLAVPQYGAEKGRRRNTPAYRKAAFRRGFPQGGAFWVWRTAVAEQAGYFDEQFKVAADFDYSLRLAMQGAQMGRVEGLLGYFTDAGQGLSTRQGASLSALERTVLQERYAIYDKIRPEDRRRVRDYDVENIHVGVDTIALRKYLPDIDRYRRARQWLKPVGSLRNALRRMLQALGILDWLHRLQGRHLKREI